MLYKVEKNIMRLTFLAFTLFVSAISSTAKAQGFPKDFSVGQEAKIVFSTNCNIDNLFWRIDGIEGNWIHLFGYEYYDKQESWKDCGWFYTGNIVRIEKWVSIGKRPQ